MISTPGDVPGAPDDKAAARKAVEQFNEHWREAEHRREAVRQLIGRFEPDAPALQVWPVIRAAGKGERASESCLRVPKPLAPVLGVRAVLRVLHCLKAAFNPVFPPIVIVSPDTEPGVREALTGEPVTFIRQPRPPGTGDAVLCAGDALRGFPGRALVAWGTQPVIQPETVRLALQLATLFPDFEMVFPTTVMEPPYAPLYRDARGRVEAAHETHLEDMHAPEFGETNIGLFLLRSETMLAELERLKISLWRESGSSYDRPRGELGFPNELICARAGRPRGVLACPIADWREEKGIKNKADVDRCEQYIRELSSRH